MKRKMKIHFDVHSKNTRTKTTYMDLTEFANLHQFLEQNVQHDGKLIGCHQRNYVKWFIITGRLNGCISLSQVI